MSEQMKKFLDMIVHNLKIVASFTKNTVDDRIVEALQKTLECFYDKND